MIKNFAQIKVGILGGGQLARMLVVAGQQLGLEVHVLSPCPQDPAAKVTPHWHKGSPDHPETLKGFLGIVDLATFESEFLDSKNVALQSKITKTKVLPAARTMGLLQDRLTQKKLLDKFRLPTAKYFAVDSFEQAIAASTQFKSGMVLKKRRFGYDGYGTIIVKKPSDLVNNKEVIEQTSEGFVAEAFVPFRRELAVSVARNRNGQVVFYPVVQSLQRDSRCFWVKGPIESKKFAPLRRKLKAMVDGLNYEGIITFELFDTGSKLLVNELAPRVHNSAHYSQNGLTEDQFTTHWKALLNLPLTSPKPLGGGFAMVNLLGTSNKVPRWSLPEGVFVHWYGKDQNRPGRKMGHINSVAKTGTDALRCALKALKEFKL